MAYEIKIVLDEIIFESFYRQRPVSYTSHEFMLGEGLPYRLDVRTVENIFQKSPTRPG